MTTKDKTAERDLGLPWRNDDPYPDVVLDKNDDEVASFGDSDDCAFAVRACNSHDALVKALKEADRALEALGVDRTHRVRWDVIRAALTAAGAPQS